MGNSVSATERKPLPIDTLFSLPSQLPSWPQGGGGGFASGSINLGGLELCQISKFNKIWQVLEGGPDDLGATFYQPLSMPDGFFTLGYYAQANNKPLSGWVLAGKDTENDSLKIPVDYTLVWSSASMKINKDGDGYVWLPTPPDGYTAVGLVVSNSPAKPALNEIRCVRSDLVESCEQDTRIWGTDEEIAKSEINVYGLRPTVRGVQALGVQVGTFSVQVNGEATPLSLSCLKNVNYNLSSMPNLTQIEELVKTYSPRIYFHPDERYLPASTNWYFSKGVQLYQLGNESNPVSVELDGSNLPQGGSNDGTYWLDLPTDQTLQDEIKKGDLQSSVSYLHIKPMLGATFTDIAMWIFYPFNGPARARVQLVNIPLGRIGEHIGDWEHVTLRISNFTGELWRVYLSEHSNGIWVNVSDLEFEEGNRFVAYASLNGHAIYPKEGLVLQGNTTLGIGIRNDAAKSDAVMDTGARYEVVSGEGFASGIISLGGLELSQISNFRKVWATLEGGPSNLGATFYEPWPIPDGFFMLGSFTQANNKPLSGWVLIAKDNANELSRGVLKMPVDYTLVWSSESIGIKKAGNGYFWLPNPPNGYNSMGLIITNTPEKPPLDKVRCVRSDVVESCEQDAWIWGASKINVYGLRPTIRGTQSLGVQVGTFSVQLDGAATSLSCLKNVNYNLSSMPNLTQIKSLVQAYSPTIYFHPDEPFLPSSVNWFFSKGALLYQKGNESNPILIEPNGLNLPQGSTDDEGYWIDLPIDDGAKDEVKKGDLQSSTTYLHIKPMLGATFTDISIWVFYPFNGPARAKVQLINIPFHKLGEHVSDWEHVTLRISNFNGELWKVYFSEHNKGTWVDASDLEFTGGKKFVAYASLHGHALYPKPGLVLQGDLKLGIGIRNDAAKSNIMMDTGVRYEVVSADYLRNIVEPQWLNYCRKWGPKISYDIDKELKVFQKLTHGKLNVTKIFPSEVLGEDGPTGPKMKNNWSGDEVI